MSAYLIKRELNEIVMSNVWPKNAVVYKQKRT